MSSKSLKKYIEAIVDPYIASLGNVQRSLLDTVSSVVSSLNNKAEKTHSHGSGTLPSTILYTSSQAYTDIVDGINSKAAKSHSHSANDLPSTIVYAPQLNTALAGKANTVHTHYYADLTDNGSEGTMAIATGDTTGVTFEDIIKYAYVSENSAEVTQAEDYQMPNKVLVETWLKLSARGATQPGSPEELDTWTYDEPNDVLMNTTNSVSYLAYYTPERFTDYTFEVLLSSTSNDDDIISIVAATAKDEDGFVHTLSFMRSPGGASGTNGTWFIAYNYRIDNAGQRNSWTVAKQTGGILWGNGGSGVTNIEAGYTEGMAGCGWGYKSNGTKVKVQRSGNIITAVTTNFDDATTYIEDERLTVDLTSDPRLVIFLTGGGVGVGTYSQPNSKYKILNFTNPSRNIYDMSRDGMLIAYDTETEAWVEDPGTDIYDMIGPGRLVFNKITGKLFHVADGYITKLSITLI